MNLGQYEIPESRLIPTVIADARTIYDATKKEPISATDMAKLLGYKTHTTSAFYRRVKALQLYGLIEGRGKFTLTSLCVKLLFPESDVDEKKSKRESVLHVSLWSELLERVGREPKADNFWVSLKNITGIDAPDAQKYQEQIRKWYLEDISLVPDLEYSRLKEPSTQSDRGVPNSQQPPSDSDNETIMFDKVVLTLPKKDLKKQWDKLQKYMKIYLEDYDESLSSNMEVIESKTDALSDNSLDYAKCPNCGKVANTLDDVKTSFGFRTHNGRQITQSWCVNCRRSNKIIN